MNGPGDDRRRETMGSPEPAEEETDVMGGGEPDEEDTDIMGDDRPHR